MPIGGWMLGWNGFPGMKGDIQAHGSGQRQEHFVEGVPFFGGADMAERREGFGAKKRAKYGDLSADKRKRALFGGTLAIAGEGSAVEEEGECRLAGH